MTPMVQQHGSDVSTLRVGIPEIDADHKTIYAYARELDDAVDKGSKLKEIQELVERLVDDSWEHFKREEALLRCWHFPNVDAHADCHRELMRQFRAMLLEVAASDSREKWIEIGQQIRDKVAEHTENEDMEYRNFVALRK